MEDKYFLTIGNREWLLTNKLGGYALGTGNLINQRKYHGLLISSDRQGNRHSLLSSLEIMVEWRGGTFHIDNANYSNCIYPEGFLHLVKSWLRPYPIFLYSSLHHNNDILVMMEIKMADKMNTVLIKFTNFGRHQLHLQIRPKVTLRNHHHINEKGCWENELLDISHSHNSFTIKRLSNELSLKGHAQEGTVSDERIIFHDCYYPWEAIRGYYGVEDLYSPARINFDLQVGRSSYLLFTDEDERLLNNPYYSSIIEGIESKYNELALPKDYPLTECLYLIKQDQDKKYPCLERLDYVGNELFTYEDYLKLLEFTLQDFIVDSDIVAGYPWFGCWGRDTFISLEAFLTMASTKDKASQVALFDTIQRIFDKYGALIKNGLLPNMLPESGQEGNYDSIDSCLWYVVRLKQFIDAIALSDIDNKDEYLESALKKALLYAKEIVSGVFNNQTYPFFIGTDGLLYLEEGFAASTWMDAKIEGKPVTSRVGAPVEINALLYNSLCSLRDLIRLPEDYCSNISNFLNFYSLSNYTDELSYSFQKFITKDYLADRIVDGKAVKECRPNAIIATSLPYPLLSRQAIKMVVNKAERELLTDYGLRSLSPSDYRFKKKYLGNQTERDSQYHQGTTWAFLLGFFAQSYFNAYANKRNTSKLKTKLTAIISPLRNEYMKGWIASVAEIYDGEKPQVPKGCPAQAWSVAALYNIEMLINRL